MEAHIPTSTYLLVLAIAEPVQSKLMQATHACSKACGTLISSGKLGYHVTVKSPFRMNDEKYEEFLRMMRAVQGTELRPTWIPSTIGSFEKPERTLYFGGEGEAIRHTITIVNALAHALDIVPLDAGFSHQLPHCRLAKDLAPEHEDICAEIFQEALPTDSVLLDAFVLYMKLENEWLFMQSFRLRQ